MGAKAKLAGAGIVVIGGVLFFTCTTHVNRGYVGVVFDQFNGGVQEHVLTSGRQFKLPWQKITEFPTVTKTIYMSAEKTEGSEEDESITIKANDGTMKANLTMSYSFDAKNISDVQKKFMGDEEYIMSLLRGQLVGWISEATSKFSTMDIHQANTEKVNLAVTEHVANKAKQYGVTIENVMISETKPSDKVMREIEARQTQEQTRKRKEEELKTLEVDKQKAQIEAEKKAIEAEGEKKANEIKAQGLDERILEQMKIEKWNGALPTVSGSDSNAIVNLK